MTSPFEASPPAANIHHLNDVQSSIRNVRVGDTVVGFSDLEVLDVFTAHLIKVHMQRMGRIRPSDVWDARGTSLQNNGDRQVPYWSATNKLPSVALQPKPVKGRKFIGKFTNISATLLSKDREPHPLPQNSDVSTVTMLLGADLHSTGRGIIGRSSKILAASEYATESNFYRSVQYENLPDDTANLAHELLLGESRGIAAALAAQGMQRAVSAGLPGLRSR